MTKQREFKLLVRERMAKTGESYTAARAQILKKQNEGPLSAPRYPGVLAGYDRFGGVQADTAVIHNVLRHAGIRSPLTGQPYSEAMVNGLCGGPGFLYAVFEYKGWPPMLTITTRSRSMPDTYVAEGLARLGVKLNTSEASSPNPARKKLEEALAAGKAVLCVADIASLPWFGLPPELAGSSPHLLAVVGREGADAWVDDRSPQPIRFSMDALAKSRATYRKAKNRMYTMDGPQAKYDARAAIRDAIADTTRSYAEPAVPKSFWVNCGLRGMEKWHAQLTDTKDKKAWPTVFAEGARAYAGLHRMYQCIEHESTAPAAGRPFYAEFLEEAADALGKPALQQAAAAYRASGELWAQVSRAVAQCPDAAVRQACAIADQRLELADAEGAGAAAASSELWRKRSQLAAECKLTRESALAFYQQLAPIVGEVVKAETAAVDLLKRAL